MMSVKKEKENINAINCKNNNFRNDVILKMVVSKIDKINIFIKLITVFLPYYV